MSEPEFLAILESKTNEISFLRSEVKALTGVIRNMTDPNEHFPHPEPEENPEMKSVALEDVIQNAQMRDEMVEWILRNVTKGQPKKGLKKKK